MILKRYLSTTTTLRRTVLTFPESKRLTIIAGQGQIVDKSLIQSLHDEYNLTEYRKSLTNQLSPQFAQQVFQSNADFYTKTSNTQPSIVSISLLILDILEKHHGIKLLDNGCIDNVMGHSLGEFTALTINDVFQHNENEILWLVRQRGLLMEEAISNSKEKYKMTALLFPAINFEDVEVLLKNAIQEVGTVGIANINNPQQIVISGESQEIDTVISLLKERSNIKRRLKAIPLQVSIPFHNPLLEDSRRKFKKIIKEKFKIEEGKPLKFPIISNLTGEEVHSHDVALDNFINDFTQPVQFKKSLEYVLENSKNDDVNFINIGPNAGVNLSSISKTDLGKKIKSNISIGNVEEIKSFVENYEKLK